MEIWKEPKYNLVTTRDQLDELKQVLQTAIKNNVPIAVDVETTGALPSSGLDIYHGWLLGLSFCVNTEEGYYIPFNHTVDGELRENQPDLKEFVKEFNPIMSSGGLWLGHNMKFDYKVLWKSGIQLYPQFWCTMTAVRLLNGDAKRRSGLKAIIGHYIEIPHKIVQTFTEASGGNAAEVDPIDFCIYATNDTIFTYYLYEELKPKIDKQYKKLYYEAEAPLIPILAHMEMMGVRIDQQYYKNIRVPLEKCRDKIKKAYEDKYKISIGSPLQVGNHLKKIYPNTQLQLSPKTQSVVTDVEALHNIGRCYKKTDSLYKFVKHILFFRGINKALTTYIDKYPAVCHQNFTNGEVEYILHTVFDQIKNSGRMSSSPNIQNITRDNEVISVRRGFIARRGKKFIEADWKGMELRIVTIDSQEAKMLKAFKDDPLNADLHTLTAQSIFKKTNVSSQERYIGKTINFSILYGATEWSISKTLNCTKEEAKKYLTLFFQTYPGIKKWKNRVEKQIKEYGFTETFYGRKRYLPFGVFPSMQAKFRYYAAIRELINHIIQGTSADLLKLAMVDMTNQFAEKGLDASLLSTTHDSVIVETSQPDEASEIILNCMETTIEGVALPVDLVVKNSFAKAV